jgi:hypothetical protein
VEKNGKRENLKMKKGGKYRKIGNRKIIFLN